jgi:hypothetical protein
MVCFVLVSVGRPVSLGAAESSPFELLLIVGRGPLSVLPPPSVPVGVITAVVWPAVEVGLLDCDVPLSVREGDVFVSVDWALSPVLVLVCAAVVLDGVFPLLSLPPLLLLLLLLFCADAAAEKTARKRNAETRRYLRKESRAMMSVQRREREEAV